MADASLHTRHRLAPLRDAWTAANAIQRSAMVLAMGLVLLALLAPVLAPHDPDAQSLLARLRPPLGFDRASPGHVWGTDELGRDILSRCLHGLRLTLTLAAAGACLGLLLGGTLGMIAGMAGGRIDDAIMGLVDAQIAIPFTLIALLILAIFGSSIQVLVLILGVAGWEQYGRIVRGEVRRLMRMPFVEAARAAGATGRRIGLRHILPNIVSPLVVQFTLALSNIVLLESTLSFLGIGIQPPTATLGSMVGMGRDYMPTAPWVVVFPALMIVCLTFAVQILGDWLRDRVDVRLRGR
ncbi:MAG: ABC transporter permease [Paracoccaceae bacterium]